jgi:hypothetical protein
MRFVRGNVRDHIDLGKIDHEPLQPLYGALQQWRYPKVNFREIFRVVRFSTFATVSAPLRHAEAGPGCLFIGVDRSAPGPMRSMLRESPCSLSSVRFSGFPS